MARTQLTKNIAIDFPDDSPEWERIRKSEGMVAYLEKVGTETVTRSNADLHAAQAARKQPVEDGYDHHITTEGSRARLYIEPTTARAIAHEAVNHTILKSLPMGTPPDATADHEIPRELQRSGGFSELLKKRKAEQQTKADKKEAALQRRRDKARQRAEERKRQ
jgi:hypothetical protein